MFTCYIDASVMGRIENTTEVWMMLITFEKLWGKAEGMDLKGGNLGQVVSLTINLASMMESE